MNLSLIRVPDCLHLEQMYSDPAQTVVQQKEKWDGKTGERTNRKDGISSSYCMQAAVTEQPDLRKQTHQLKQLPAPEADGFV